MRFNTSYSNERDHDEANIGPGSYETNHVKFLKNYPRIRIGKTKRKLTECNLLGPGPEKYSTHKKMTEKKNLSTERNTINTIFGTEIKEKKDFIETPGPLDYDTVNRCKIGDQ